MGGVHRSLWWRAVAVAFAIAAVTVAVLTVWFSPKADLLDKGEFLTGAAVVLLGPARWAWSKASVIPLGLEELGPLADQLAVAVEKQWKDEADGRGLLEPTPIPVRWTRPSKPVAGSSGDAVDSRLFKPLPGTPGAAEVKRRVRAGLVSQLYQVYGGLGSGRLIITGKPGSGKSGAAVLLILAGLDHRRSLDDGSERAQVPVPVMFSFDGWNPVSQSLQEWLVDRLSQTYTMFESKRGRLTAGGLLADGKIAVILDGLDEIPAAMRPVALRRLSREATTFRLVLLTRTDELAEAAEETLLQGAAAIELQDLDARTAAAYLKRTQPDRPSVGWRELIRDLPKYPDSPLAHALDNPLMLTVVRDTYRHSDDPSELGRLPQVSGHSPSAEDIADYLLDRVLPAAYAQQLGESPSPYSRETAQRALRCIAARMNKDGTRDLAWWHIVDWTSSVAGFIISGVVGGVLTGLVAWLGLGPAIKSLFFGQVAPLWVGLYFFGIAGPAAGIGFMTNKFAFSAIRMQPQWWRHLFRRKGFRAGLRVALWFGLGGMIIGGGGVAFGLVLAEGAGGVGNGLRLGVEVGLRAGLLVGLVVGSLAWLLASIAHTGMEDTSPLSPLASWRSNATFGLVAILVIGLVVGLPAGLLFGLGPWRVFGMGGAGLGAADGTRVGLSIGLMFGIVTLFWASSAWSSSLGFALLARSDGTPVRLMRFLEDAHDRNVLRTVGPVYQFRHARLQDRLAAQRSPTALGDGKADRTAPGAEAPTAFDPAEHHR